MDVDQSQDLDNLFGIRSIPTMVIFKDGKPVDALVGVHPKQTLMEKIQAQLSLGDLPSRYFSSAPSYFFIWHSAYPDEFISL